VTEEYKNKSLEKISEAYYSPEDKMFGNESMDYAICEAFLKNSKKDRVSLLGEEMVNLYKNFKKNFKDEVNMYIEFLPEIMDDCSVIKDKEKFIKNSLSNKKETLYMLISARLRKEFFGNYINKEHKRIYSFFKKFNGNTREKLKDSLEYVFKNYPDNEAINVLDENLFYFYIKEKADLENLKFDNFYIYTKEFIKNLNKDEKDYRILKKLVEEEGFKEKLLVKRVSSFFKIKHYKEYLTQSAKDNGYEGDLGESEYE